jgi:hypothetical protein
MSRRKRKGTTRYRPVLSRGECSLCGHWQILQNGVCAGCRNRRAIRASIVVLVAYRIVRKRGAPH